MHSSRKKKKASRQGIGGGVRDFRVENFEEGGGGEANQGKEEAKGGVRSCCSAGDCLQPFGNHGGKEGLVKAEWEDKGGGVSKAIFQKVGLIRPGGVSAEILRGATKTLEISRGRYEVYQGAGERRGVCVAMEKERLEDVRKRTEGTTTSRGGG